jgi:hypothetical protein
LLDICTVGNKYCAYSELFVALAVRFTLPHLAFIQASKSDIVLFRLVINSSYVWSLLKILEESVIKANSLSDNAQNVAHSPFKSTRFFNAADAVIVLYQLL